MRLDKRSRKIRTKKKRKKIGKPASFWGYLAFGVVLLGLFYFVVYTGHEKQLRRIRQEKIQEDFDRICSAAILYFQDHEKYPSTDMGMEVLVRNEDRASESEDPVVGFGYLDRIPLDPWGNPYEHEVSPKGDRITLICRGSDGVPEGTGEASDVIRQGCRSTALPLL